MTLYFRNREEVYDSHCQSLEEAFYEEICNWNKSVENLSPPDSPEAHSDRSEASSPSSNPSDNSSVSPISHSGMDNNNAYHGGRFADQWTGEARSEMPQEQEYYDATSWIDAIIPGRTPLSPVMSVTNQSAYTMSGSDFSLDSFGTVTSHAMQSLDHVLSPWGLATENVSSACSQGPHVSADFFSYSPHEDMDVDSTLSPWIFDTKMEPLFQSDVHANVRDPVPLPSQTAGFVGEQFAVENPALSQVTSACLPHRFQNVYHGEGQLPNPIGHGRPTRMNAGNSVTNEMQQAAPEQRQPRRLSVAVNPTATWSPEESEKSMGFPVSMQNYAGYSNYAPLTASNVHYASHMSAASSGAGSIGNSASYERSPTIIRPDSPTDSAHKDSDGRARNHEYYSAKPLADGFFHCPLVSVEKCAHKPTKLKCNYEYDISRSVDCDSCPETNYCANSKYIDSHIKPFRCKHENCNNNQFSSTACLLRHEREAHGLHGHGEKPFHCYYKDCERSQDGNGFPRNYNLMDHMKRVHGYEPPTKAASLSSESRRARSSSSKVRKRKATDLPAQRQKSGSVSRKGVAISPAKEDSMPWVAHKHSLKQRLDRMQNPQEAAQLIPELHSLSRQRYG